MRHRLAAQDAHRRRTFMYTQMPARHTHASDEHGAQEGEWGSDSQSFKLQPRTTKMKKQSEVCERKGSERQVRLRART